MSDVQGASSLAGSGSCNKQALLFNIAQLKVPQLKGLCRSLGLSAVAKRKQDLLERVVNFVESIRLAENGAEILAIDLLVMKLLNNDTIPSFMHLVQSMRLGLVNQQGVSNLMQDFRQASGLNRSIAPRAVSSSVSQYGEANAHTPIEDTYNGPMLLFNSTLLYNIRSAVGPHQVLRASKGRYAKQFAIQLLSTELQLLNSSKDMRIYIFSALESTPDPSNAKIQFPPIEIYVDGVLTKQFLRGIKGKAGTARPADITPYITRDTKPSHVRIVYSDAAEKFILYPHIVQEFLPSSIVESINSRPHISAVYTKQKIKHDSEAADDDDLQVATASLSLRCPITYARIHYPFTSVECDHIQCFDGLSFLTMQQRVPAWQCPVCSNTIREDLLCVSDYIKTILDSVSEEVDSVKLEADGSWSIITDDDPKTESSNKQSDEAAATTNDAISEENIEIISLDSDSDEDTTAAASNTQYKADVDATTTLNSTTVLPETSPVGQDTTLQKPNPPDPSQNHPCDSGISQAQTTESSTIALSRSAQADEGPSATLEITQKSSSNEVAPSETVDTNQDSDDDRVLATYRRTSRPRIDATATADSRTGSRPMSPVTNDTSDLTPFPESAGNMYSGDRHPVSETLPGSTNETEEFHDTSNPEPIVQNLPEPLLNSAVQNTNPETVIPEPSDTLVHLIEVPDDRTESTQKAPITHSPKSVPNPVQNSDFNRISLGAGGNPPADIREILPNTEPQQGEVRHGKSPTPTLNGNSIISTIHDQISKSVSPSLSISPTSAMAPSYNSSNNLNYATRLNYKPQNSQGTNYPPTINLAKTNLSNHTWQNSPSASFGQMRPSAQRAVQNVFAHLDSSESAGVSAPMNNQNDQSHHNPNYRGGPAQPVYGRYSLFNQYATRNPNASFMGTPHHGDDRNQVRSKYEARISQAHSNFREQLSQQDVFQQYSQNENIPSRESNDSAWHHIYGLSENQNAHLGTTPNAFARSIAYNGNRSNPMNRQSMLYQQLIAMSSNMINAYNQAFSYNPRNSIRAPPPARLASSIAKNTAFEFLNPRQHAVNEPQTVPLSPLTPTMERPLYSSNRASEPTIPRSDMMSDPSRRIGASSVTLPVMNRHHSTGNAFNYTRNSMEGTTQFVNMGTQSPELTASPRVVAEQLQTMLKGLLGIEIASNALSSVEPRSDPISDSNSYSHDDSLQNSTANSLDNHIQDMLLQTPASRKRTIDDNRGSSKRSSQLEKFNVNEINSSDIIELD